MQPLKTSRKVSGAIDAKHLFLICNSSPNRMVGVVWINTFAMSSNSNALNYIYGHLVSRMPRGNGAHNAIKMRRSKIKSFLNNKDSKNRRQMKNSNKDYSQKPRKPICNNNNNNNNNNNFLDTIAQLQLQFQSSNIIKKLILMPKC